MRPDFKETPTSKRHRRQSAVKMREPASGSYTQLVSNAGAFWQRHWHIGSAALISLVLIGLSVWAMNKSPNAELKQQEPKDEQLSAANEDVLVVQAVKPNDWVSVPLELPPSEAEKFQQVLESNNLIHRTADTNSQNKTTAAVSKAKTPEDDIDWQDWRVKSGDSLASMAKRYGVKSSEIYYLMQNNDAAKVLKRIYPKQLIRVNSSDGQILQLQYDIKDTQRLVVSRKDNTIGVSNPFNIEIVERPYEVQTAFAQGVIEDSLFLAGTKAGISDRLTMELAGIFGWDIDFVQDIRQGDRFSLLFEERYRDGERLPGSRSEGNILAAEFINNGRKIRAIRYTLPDGRTDYFTPEGKSLRKAFIRNPVDFARISSRFNLKRLHPILNKIRAHKGVDYAAPIGTPIRSAGDGKVVFRGTKGGYGHTIIIQHGSRYSTLYAHMSKYARNSNVGKRVRQGQIIGYIGKSGLATGPHLHYEFRVNGVHRNPLTIKHPSVKPIPKEHLADFKSATADIIAQLDLVGQAQYASINQ